MKKGWQTKTLGDVCHVYQPATISQKQMIAGEFRVYGANGQIGWHNQFNHEEPELILGCRGSCGTVHVTEPQSWINGNAMVVHPTNGAMDISFLAYALKGGIELTDAITGAAQPQITRTSLMPLVISFPESLAEQQRIVGILDEAFAGIARAKANAEQNLQNARALFESHLQAVFSQRGEGWVETTVGAEIRFIDYRGKTPVKTEIGIRLITAKNVKMGYLQESPMEYIAADNYESWMTRGIPKKGDVLFTTEAPLANVAQLDTDEKVAFAQRIIIMQPNAEKLDCTFLKYLLLSQPVQERIRSKGTGATVQGIKASLLKTIEISFPISLQEQRRIVAQLDALALETRSLAAIYERKLAALEELKKSLLHQAFSGEL
jgi:type I restriction enzyme S subunit